MLCEMCGRESTTSIYSEVANGQASTMRLCAECLEHKRQVGPQAVPTPKPKEDWVVIGTDPTIVPRRPKPPKGEAWDAAAEWFPESRERPDSENMRIETPTVLERIGDCRDPRVLDLGCTAGFYARQCAARGAFACGMDLSEKMLERAKTLSPDVHFVRARAGSDLPFRDGAFDLVVCSALLRLVPEKDVLLRECARILVPRGRLILSDLHPYMQAWGRGFYRRMVVGGSTGITASYFSHEPYDALINDFGFRVYPVTMADIFNGLITAGLTLLSVDEPQVEMPPSIRIANAPDSAIIPYFLIVTAQRS